MKYQELYEHYYTMVYRLSLLLLKNTHDAEDATQTVFLKIMEKEPEFKDENHARAWLITVTRNYCRDVQRSFWHRKRTDLEQLPEQAIEPFDKQESLLFEIFQTLPSKQREIVYLYYFEDYSIKEIAGILNRNESTIQSQLFAARKRMKNQFSASKAAALILCLTIIVGFGGIAADAASGGKAQAAIREMGQKVQISIHRLLSDEETQIADETVSLPIQVFASELVGIDDRYLILANERGLLIYERSQKEIVSVIDLQQIECNYLNANSIATRIFKDGDRLYLFNESILPELREDEIAPLPEVVYSYDLSGLSAKNANHLADNKQNLNAGSTFDEGSLLTRLTSAQEIQNIYDLWNSHAKDHIRDTFESFYGADFLDDDSAKFDDTKYSRNSLAWTDKSGKNVLSCLVVDGNSNYELYTKYSDGTMTSEPLHLIVSEAPSTAPDHTSTASINGTPPSSGEEMTDRASDTSDLLPEFVYTGNDDVLATVCAYMIASDDRQMYLHTDASVYIPAPVIYGVVSEGDDLVVFVNQWSYWYYRNGNMLECESGGEAPSRLRLHPKNGASGGYEVIEEIRTGNGSDYAKGIQAFCEGYPGMEEKFFLYESSPIDNIRTSLIRMYVQDNDLDITYYKDYGWDPVSIK